MRPRGVAILSLVMVFSGSILFISGVSMIVMKDVALPIFAEEYRMVINQTLNQSFNQTLIPATEENIELFYTLIAYIAIAVGGIYALTGIGLWLLKEWARILTVILSGLAAIYSFFALFLDPIFAFQLGINIVIIWYLMKRGVREAFTGRQPSIEEKILGEGWKD